MLASGYQVLGFSNFIIIFQPIKEFKETLKGTPKRTLKGSYSLPLMFSHLRSLSNINQHQRQGTTSSREQQLQATVVAAGTSSNGGRQQHLASILQIFNFEPIFSYFFIGFDVLVRFSFFFFSFFLLFLFSCTYVIPSLCCLFDYSLRFSFQTLCEFNFSNLKILFLICCSLIFIDSFFMQKFKLCYTC